MKPRGIILAGGKGTRLLPATRSLNKHMIPILNEPMILYPLRTLRELGVKDILVVTGGDHIGGIAEFLGDGSEYDVNLTYRVQKEAGGIAQALSLAEDFAQGSSVYVILGDNIYDYPVLPILVKRALTPENCLNALIFTTRHVKDMTRFGVMRHSNPPRIIEKPVEAKKTDSVITGLYYYPNNVFELLPTFEPSARGELEISDVNNYYLNAGCLTEVDLKGYFWTDAGTPDSLFEATSWAHKGYPQR